MKKKSIALILAFMMALSLLATACGGGTAQSPAPSPTASANGEASQTGETVSFTDSAGRVVELPAKIDKIAPTGTMAQIVLFALAPDKFVGLSNKWPESAGIYVDEKYKNLPVFGQFYGVADLNMEALAASKPQVIIDIGEKKDSIKEDMDNIQSQLGIPTIFIEASLTTMSDCYTTLGKILGLEEDAKVLSEYCNSVYERMTSGMEKVGEDNKVTALYCLGDTGTNILAANSYHTEIFDKIVKNVGVVENPSSKGSGNEVSLEQIYLWNPDVILFAPDSIYDSVKNETAWQKVKAISSKKYYEVPNSPYNWMGNPPSVNRYMGMIWLPAILYPDVFDYDLYEETAKYYKLFYHSDLTQEQFDALIANSK